MAKEILTVLKLQVPAGQATVGQKLAQALSPHGVNAGEFVTQFNEKTSKDFESGLILRVTLTIFADRTFKFDLKGAPTSELIKRAIKLKAGSGRPNLDKVGKLSQAQLEEIAKAKLVDLNTRSLEDAIKTVEGTARQMGVEIQK
jgi:large subunit ribosomal protein L11